MKKALLGIVFLLSTVVQATSEIPEIIGEEGQATRAHPRQIPLNEDGDEVRQGQGEPKSNLAQQSLLLSLPDEVLLKIMHFFDLKDLIFFQRTCRKAHYFANDHSIQYKFLERLDIGQASREWFTVSHALFIDEANLEVHFRDAAHLKDIAYHNPRIQLAGGARLIFVLDPDMPAGSSVLIKPGFRGLAVRKKIILVDSYKLDSLQKSFDSFGEDIFFKPPGESYLTFSEYLLNRPSIKNIKSPYLMYNLYDHYPGLEPPTYDFVPSSALTKKNTSEIMKKKLETIERFDKYSDQIIETSGRYSTKLINARTTLATQLFKDRLWDRHCNPNKYENFFHAYPECKDHGNVLEATSADFLKSDHPIVHVGNNYEDVSKFLVSLPSCFPLILIDTRLKTSGVFCKSDMSLKQGFKLRRRDIGGIYLPYSAKGNSYHYICLDGNKIHFQGVKFSWKWSQGEIIETLINCNLSLVDIEICRNAFARRASVKTSELQAQVDSIRQWKRFMSLFKEK